MEIGPEFKESILSHFSHESPCRALKGLAGVGLTIGAPGVREKIAAWDGNKTRISRHELPVAVVGQKSREHHILDSSFEGLGVGLKVARVFAPKGPKSGFHDIARCRLTEPDPEAFAEA